jgi:hypothetical protein
VATTVAPDQGWDSYLNQIAIHGVPPGYPTAAPTDPGPSSAAAAATAAAAAAPHADAPAALQAAASSFFAGFSFPAGGAVSALVPWDGGTGAPAAPSVNAGSMPAVASVFSSESGELPFSHESLTQVTSMSGEAQWVFVPNYGGSDWLSDWFA